MSHTTVTADAVIANTLAALDTGAMIDVYLTSGTVLVDVVVDDVREDAYLMRADGRHLTVPRGHIVAVGT